MTIDQSIIDRVRKLFALAADRANENESHVALEMARKLMKEHGIKQVDVDISDAASHVDVQLWKSVEMSQIDTYSRYLAIAVSKLFDCQHWLMRGTSWNKYRVQVCFAGEATDVALATEVWPWFVKQAKRYAQSHYGSGWTPRHRSFAESFASRIHSRILDMLTQEEQSSSDDDVRYGIVVAGKESAIEKFLEQQGIKFVMRSLNRRGRQYYDAINAGQRAADSVNLNFRSQIEGKPINQKALGHR